MGNAETAGRTQGTPEEPSQAFSVLVADDEEGMREAMRRVLEKRGYQVELAENGARAIELIDKRRYDIALIDLRMPDVDGFAVTEHIARTKASRTVVVIVSALATVEAAVGTTRNGAFDFLVKPFNPDDLLRVVERAAGQHTLIADREKYLLELNSERSLARQLINSMNEGVIVFNVRREAVLFNPRAEFYLGDRYRSGYLCGDLPFGREVDEAIGTILAGEGAERVVEHELADRRLRIRIAPYEVENEVDGAILLLTDVTTEWRAREDKDRFVSMVAHELNAPVAAIVSYLKMILDGLLADDPARSDELLRRSLARGQGLLELIKDLQHLNRRMAGKLEKSYEQLDLCAVLNDEIAFVREQAERSMVKLVLELPDEPVTLSADRGDLDHIFMNLLFNGIKYNRADGTLRVTLERSDDGRWIVVSFRDDGIGMSEAEMANLFQDFYRVKNEKTAGISGTGLGLATAKRVAADYNGTIGVASAPNEGSTFTVKLPT